MALITKQAWTSTGTSGAMTAIEVPESPNYAVLYVDHSTLATTQSASFQTAQNSTGPWFIEGSTQIAAANATTNFAMRVTGPIGPWVRPYLHTSSTGSYDFLLIGVS